MTPTDSSSHHEHAPFQPIAAILAIIFPGAGHAYLGETRRAILIACGVLGLFFGGVLIGGIDVVDKKEDFVWFVGEALVGPIAFGTDYYHQHHLKVRVQVRNQLRSANPYEIRDPKTAYPIVVRNPETGAPVDFVDPRTNQVRTSTDADRPPNSKSVGRVNELGTLFAAIAGMLNLICIIDAAYRHNIRAPRREGAF
ncbi:MAG: hypothetical protein H7210_04110 [Pyrinomonadaceae bacterium]|nr:hypothetical protein [Phycisphaerales bacterium]